MTSTVHAVNPRPSRVESSRLDAVHRDLARAEQDYQRLRTAYLDLAQNDYGNEVALAMVGADMDRAHITLQGLTGLRQLPFTHEPTQVMRREARRLVAENS